MTQRPTLTEPIEWKTWKTRRRNIAIVGSVSTYEGTNVFGLREHVIGSDGIMRPTTRGVSMALKRLPEIVDMFNKMLRRSQEIGLLAHQDEGRSE